jgi:ABC-type branched-subunit amino acid transport system substrate-binding protein
MTRVTFLIALATLLCAADDLRIGQACALDGPAKGLGTGMNLGLRAALDEANAAGGVQGRKLVLVAKDDGYDPDKCIDAVGNLVEEDKVFCLAGFVGTPTAKAALPIATEAGVPVVGLFTGAMFLRTPPQKLVFNVRASYNDETEVLVERLGTDLGAKRIAVFHQNDSFGQAGLAGTTKALEKRSLKVAATGTFERNTVAVQTGLAAILAAKPDAIIMVGPYKPLAVFVKEARAAGLSCPLATISFVGTESLIAELGAAADGLVISQVVPSPSDASLPLAKAYQAALAKAQADAKPSYVSFEGYISGRVLLAGLDKAGADPTREKLVTGLEALSSLDLGGFTVSFAADRRQASDKVWLTRVAGGAAQPVESLK